MGNILVAKIFGWVVGGGCFLAGIGLLFFSKSMKRANQILNKAFYPVESLEKLFGREVKNDQWITSNTKVLGFISLLVSVVFFVVLLTT